MTGIAGEYWRSVGACHIQRLVAIEGSKEIVIWPTLVAPTKTMHHCPCGEVKFKTTLSFRLKSLLMLFTLQELTGQSSPGIWRAETKSPDVMAWTR